LRPILTPDLGGTEVTGSGASTQRVTGFSLGTCTAEWTRRTWRIKRPAARLVTMRWILVPFSQPVCSLARWRRRRLPLTTNYTKTLGVNRHEDYYGTSWV